MPRPTEHEFERFFVASDQGYVPRRLTGYITTAIAGAFFIFLLVERETAAKALDLGSSSIGAMILWILLFFVALALTHAITHTIVGPTIFYLITKIPYRQDRIAYARAGGYDIDNFLPVLVLVGTFAVFWATSDSDPDPIGFLRSGWGFALTTVVAGVVVHAIVSAVTFAITTRRVR